MFIGMCCSPSCVALRAASFLLVFLVVKIYSMTKSEQQYQEMIDLYKGLLKTAEQNIKENKHDVLIPFYENIIRNHKDMIRTLMAKQIACRF